MIDKKRHPQLKAKSFNLANSKGKIYINSGDFKGRKLKVVSADDLRPSLLANRQLMINWLAFEQYRGVLDLFAGSGSLALELLSNKAQFAAAIEKDPKVFKSLTENYQQITSQSNRAYQLIQAGALEVLEQADKYFKADSSPFDLVVIDPPFALSVDPAWMEQLFIKLDNFRLLTDSSKLFIELDASFAWNSFVQQIQPKLSKKLQQLKIKTTKQLTILLLEFAKDE